MSHLQPASGAVGKRRTRGDKSEDECRKQKKTDRNVEEPTQTEREMETLGGFTVSLPQLSGPH